MSRSTPLGGLAGALGLEIPTVAAPMAGGPGTPELVVAAAAAGGIGFLAAGYKSAHQLAEQITQVRASTPRFGVNLFVPNPVPVDPAAYRDYLDLLRPWADRFGVELPERPLEDDDAWREKHQLLVDNPVPVVSLTFGLPERESIASLQRAGSRVLQTVTSAAEALRAEAVGVDGLIVQSSQAGGHSGSWTPRRHSDETTTVALVRRIRAVSSRPIWAAGGIVSASDVQQVLTAGAEAAIIGTALLRTPESGAHPVHQQALADAHGGETVMTRAFSGRPARGLRNAFTDEFSAAAPLGFPALHHLTSPLRRASAAAGDPAGLNLWAGTGWRAATTEPTGEVLRRLAAR
ncbi:NAD(P)H-dependent flavin oxidoreductase [Nesterenkonia sphaerica]|uniref:Propionate 3-nitronate monooxygenase n=1 Tax=Nesterenkonia sphaerica TaxID=1804988 RepID=A0A5R9AF81_9MICC|nr:nitronate monooxygenase [Nesterenkonia sphaerica]TLP76814.1 nitronate monooxygenase [Nesterenkonia sphaerica]